MLFDGQLMDGVHLAHKRAVEPRRVSGPAPIQWTN